jgi:hypothetical protein
MDQHAEDCPECRELDRRIKRRIAAKDEATQQFSSAMRQEMPAESRREWAAKAYEAEIELGVLYEAQIIHELLHSDPNNWLKNST